MGIYRGTPLHAQCDVCKDVTTNTQLKNLEEKVLERMNEATFMRVVEALGIEPDLYLHTHTRPEEEFDFAICPACVAGALLDLYKADDD